MRRAVGVIEPSMSMARPRGRTLVPQPSQAYRAIDTRTRPTVVSTGDTSRPAWRIRSPHSGHDRAFPAPPSDRSRTYAASRPRRQQRRPPHAPVHERRMRLRLPACRRRRQLRRRVLRHRRRQLLLRRLQLALAFPALVGDSPCRHRGHPPFLGLIAPARIECPRWLLPPALGTATSG